jgi:hypothetical protein
MIASCIQLVSKEYVELYPHYSIHPHRVVHNKTQEHPPDFEASSAYSTATFGDLEEENKEVFHLQLVTFCNHVVSVVHE